MLEITSVHKNFKEDQLVDGSVTSLKLQAQCSFHYITLLHQETFS